MLGHTNINSIKSVLKLSASQRYHLASLAHSKTFEQTW